MSLYSFSGHDLIYRELVLSLYYKERKDSNGGIYLELTAGIHGQWYYNIADGSHMINLKNEEPVDDLLKKQIEDFVQAEFKAMKQGTIMLWRPRGKRTSTPKHLIHETTLHNVYGGKIFRTDCIQQATRYMSASDPSSLVSFFKLFKEKLATETGGDDLEKLSDFAKSHYGWRPRITVKTKHQVDFGFLFTDADAPLDNPFRTPKGSSKDFSDFCNAQ